MNEENNFYASCPELVSLGSNVVFRQKTIFNGLGKIKVGNFVEVGWPYSPHFYGFYSMFLAESRESHIEIGDNTNFSNDVSIRAMKEIIIGKNCLIGDRVTIYDCDMHEINPFFRRRSYGKALPVLIEDNVWIGSCVIVLKGVTIGENSVVSAGSVVTRDVPRNSIVMGNPAKVVKEDILSDTNNLVLEECREKIKSQLVSYIEENELQKAKQLMKTWGALLDCDIEIYSIKGIIFMKEGLFDQAEEVFKEGLKKGGNNFDILYNLGYLFEEKNNLDQAIIFYQKAMEQSKSDELVYKIKEHIDRLRGSDIVY